MIAASAERLAVTEADRVRLEGLFNQHHAVVWRALRRRGLTPDATADATQETFLLAARRLGDIRPGSERAFLVGTALRMAHSLGRKTIRWVLDADMDQHVSGGRDASDVGADVQLCNLVLSRVDSDLMEVLVLYEVEGLTSPEISQLLEIPLGSVASRLRRAREQFREAATRIQHSVEREGKK